jgi:hypothetical protein
MKTVSNFSVFHYAILDKIPCSMFLLFKAQHLPFFPAVRVLFLILHIAKSFQGLKPMMLLYHCIMPTCCPDDWTTLIHSYANVEKKFCVKITSINTTFAKIQGFEGSGILSAFLNTNFAHRANYGFCENQHMK